MSECVCVRACTRQGDLAEVSGARQCQSFLRMHILNHNLGSLVVAAPLCIVCTCHDIDFNCDLQACSILDSVTMTCRTVAGIGASLPVVIYYNADQLAMGTSTGVLTISYTAPAITTTSVFSGAASLTSLATFGGDVLSVTGSCWFGISSLV